MPFSDLVLMAAGFFQFIWQIASLTSFCKRLQKKIKKSPVMAVLCSPGYPGYPDMSPLINVLNPHLKCISKRQKVEEKGERILALKNPCCGARALGLLA